MVAAGTVMEDKEIAQSGSSDFEELRRQIYVSQEMIKLSFL